MAQKKENQEKIDLSEKLKDSDTDMKFQNEERQSVQAFLPETPKIIQWIVKYSGGLIRDEKQAQYVLLGFVALTIIIVVVIAVSGGSNQPVPGPVPTDQFVP